MFLLLILGSKAGKNDIFGSVISRIVENGGGNASNLTCNGKLNGGASQLTNLTETLINCEEEIKNNCNPSNLPQPNMTEVTNCNIAIDAFKKKSDECFKTAGSAACTCWSDSTLETAAKTIKSCDCKETVSGLQCITQCIFSVKGLQTICEGIEEVYQYFWEM